MAKHSCWERPFIVRTASSKPLEMSRTETLTMPTLRREVNRQLICMARRLINSYQLLEFIGVPKDKFVLTTPALYGCLVSYASTIIKKQLFFCWHWNLPRRRSNAELFLSTSLSATSDMNGRLSL